MLKHLVSFGLFFIPAIAGAHSFDERYDLPIPLEFFLVGGGIVIAISFLLIILAAKHWPSFGNRTSCEVLSVSAKAANWILYFGRILGLTFFGLVIAAGILGPGNPLLNLAPNFIWITWWLGFSIAIAV